MATELQIAGWKAHGLRCPDHEISFLNGPDSVFPISLVQMPTGTGKTTTLKLLRAALSGAAANNEWGASEVRAYGKQAGPRKGMFQVVTLHNGHRITFTMEFDFEDGIVEYATTLPTGMRHGFHPPRDLERFFQPDFVDLFVFDGELAERLLDASHTNAQGAIEDLFQLKVFSQLASRARDYWEDAASGKTATDRKGFTRRRNRVQAFKKRIKELTAEQDRIRKEYEEKRDQLACKKSKFQNDIEAQSAHEDRLRKAREALKEIQHNVELLTHGVLRQMQKPHFLSAAFAEEIATLKDSFDRVKLPEQAAREFFEELAEEPVCVCNRPNDAASRQAIRERASHYLGSDDVSLLNAIKSDISVHVGKEAGSHEQALREGIQQLLAAIVVAEERRTERDALEAQEVNGNPELEAARGEIRALEEEVEALQLMLAAYEDSSDSGKDSDVLSIEVLKKRLKDAERDLAEITQTLEIKAKTDVLTEILGAAQVVARQRLSATICEEANKKIALILPYNDIRIERVDKCLRLVGRGGASMGETLSVAYGFLATLFVSSEHELPFVVDSPAGSLDDNRRIEVGELIPRLGRQFLAFMINTEHEYFLPSLEASARGSIQYVTLFRKGPTAVEKAAKACADFGETKDGFCVVDRDFFWDFSLEKED